MFHFYLKNRASIFFHKVHIIEDFKLDFHSTNNEIPDASRIGEITNQIMQNKITMHQEMEP